MRMWSKYETQRENRGRAVSFEELWKEAFSFSLSSIFFLSKKVSFFLSLVAVTILSSNKIK